MDLDDVVATQIERLESFEVPENGLGHRGQRVAGQVEALKRVSQRRQIRSANLGNEVV